MSDKPVPIQKVNEPLIDGQTERVDDHTRRLYDDVSKSVVHIFASGKGYSSGSGFLIDNKGTVVTDAHVILGEPVLRVRTPNGEFIDAKLKDIDDVNDLAVLELVSKPQGMKPLALAESSKGLRAGEKVFALGHPQGKIPIYLSPGNFVEDSSAFHMNFKILGLSAIPDLANRTMRHYPQDRPDFLRDQFRTVLHAKLHLEPGNSGGPLVTEDRKLVGVADWLLVADHSQTYFTPVERVHDVLQRDEPKFKFNYQYKRSTVGDMLVESPGFALVTTAATSAAWKTVSRVPRANVVPLVAGGTMLLSDFSTYRSALLPERQMKYGFASAADTGIIGGATLGLLANRVQGFGRRSGYIGAGLLAAGLLGRIAVEAIGDSPYLVDIERTDGDLRGPYRRKERIAIVPDVIPRNHSPFLPPIEPPQNQKETPKVQPDAPKVQIEPVLPLPPIQERFAPIPKHLPGLQGIPKSLIPVGPRDSQLKPIPEEKKK